MPATMSTLSSMIIPSRELLQRLVDRFIEQPDGCWTYGNCKPMKNGYVATQVGWPNPKSIRVHRAAWLYFKGDIPEGFVIDHICHNEAMERGECSGGTSCKHRQCVNPDHLRIVPAGTNNSITSRVVEYRDTCRNGHSNEHVKVGTNGRYCGACAAESKRRSDARLRGTAEFKERAREAQKRYRERKRVA